MLSVLPHLNYKAWFALAEFVDNALESAIVKGDALRRVDGPEYILRVDIELDPGARRIVVRDNAAGIDESAYHRAFIPASPPLEKRLSEFGMGMKSAACWFAPRWQVRTKALGEKVERTVEFDIERIVSEKRERLSVKSIMARPEAHYTEIMLSDVRHFPVKRTLGKIRDHLESIYRRFLRNGTLHLVLNGEPLSFDEPTILRAPAYSNPDGAPLLWRKSVAFEMSNGKRAEGFLAIRERGSTSHAGLALFRYNRLIQGSADETYRPPEIFGSPNSYAYQRIFGELDLHGFHVSHTKDGVRWEDGEAELIDHLVRELNDPDLPLLRQAEQYRSKGALRSERAKAAKALDSLETGVAPLSGTSHAAAVRSVEERLRVLDPASLQPPHILPASPADTRRQFRVEHGSVAWIIDVSLSYDDEGRDWLTLSDTGREASRQRHLGTKIAMVHPFMDQFCDGSTGQVEALIRLAVALAIAEATARDAGVRLAGIIRTNLNDLLRLSLSRA